MLRFLRDSNPSSQVIAMGILPRGWEDEARRYTWPSRYSPSIAFVNAALAQYASQDDMVHYLNCGPMLLHNGTVSTASSLSLAWFRFFCFISLICKFLVD